MRAQHCRSSTNENPGYISVVSQGGTGGRGGRGSWSQRETSREVEWDRHLAWRHLYHLRIVKDLADSEDPVLSSPALRGCHPVWLWWRERWRGCIRTAAFSWRTSRTSGEMCQPWTISISSKAQALTDPTRLPEWFTLIGQDRWDSVLWLVGILILLMPVSMPW